MQLSIKTTSRVLRLPAIVFILTAALLTVVQLRLTENPLILLERFIPGAGWIEILIVSLYGALVISKMQDPVNVPRWRRITWTLFSVVFFTQLALGLLGAERILMTGKLHLPIPAMIISGPLYRGELSVMTILFLSTVLLTGPAWCSQLCYFGAFDSIAASGKTKRGAIKNKKGLKATFILLVIVVTLLLSWIGVTPLFSTLAGLIFGVAGIMVMILLTRRQKRMIHCTLYCPVGTVVSLVKPVNPFRLYIDESCDLCNKCTTWCKYDALNIRDIRNKK
ncbi:MAG: 4Fe-4S binding protein, partial [Bacteroidetes bacterium]|nr:4Fe-4S binding protein [Bacteroidota bacterium]